MAKKTDTNLVTVTAAVTLHEAGVTYAPGESFQTSPERAEALGDVVTTAGAAPAEPA